MAERARLIPPQDNLPDQGWDIATGTIQLSALTNGERRLEAGTYLKDGYGIAQALRARADCVPLQSLARVWQPNRLKGVQVDAAHGTPFLAATQVFDYRPIPRKWLALQQTKGAADRFVAEDTILVTCSGSVGRATLAFDAHRQTLISHDLLRIVPYDESLRGWLFAYLRAPKVRLMMQSAHYGHMIKHLESSHLDVLPVPIPVDAVRARCTGLLRTIQRARNEAHRLIEDVERQYEKAIAASETVSSGPAFSVSLRILSQARRRLDASYNVPTVQQLKQTITAGATTTLRDAGYRAWLPNRFQRIPAADGVELVSSSALFEINPDEGERIADRGFGDDARGRVERGWLLIARSGQTYGLVGSVAMATNATAHKVISDHVIRLAPGPKTTMRPGYVFAALSHPTLGRPLLKALPSGSSIPSIDFEDVLDCYIRRLGPLEDELADKIDRASQLRARADLLERKLSLIADEVITGAQS